jgi:hypothetical protein
LLRPSKINPNGISKSGLKSTHLAVTDSPFELKKTAQLQKKLMKAAVTEIKLLLRREEWVNRTIAKAARSGANRINQTSVLLIRMSQNFKLLMSSTWIVRRARKSATMIANPTATSAAATVIIKKTKTCAL